LRRLAKNFVEVTFKRFSWKLGNKRRSQREGRMERKWNGKEKDGKESKAT